MFDSLKSLLAAVRQAIASNLVLTDGMPTFPNLVKPHTNPARNAERKQCRLMGRRQWVKARKYMNARAR